MLIASMVLAATLSFQSAQATADTLVHLPVLGGYLEDRMRLEQLRGPHPDADEQWVIRSPSRLLEAGRDTSTRESTRFRRQWLAPRLHTVWNSDLPFSLNEGPLWAGRGLGARLTMGAVVRFGRTTLTLAPEIIVEQNRPFQTVSLPTGWDDTRRHPLASAFHYPPQSMDLPQRLGTDSRLLLALGQSSVRVRTGRLAFGAATENLWWGPGIRNALVMGSQAPGIPHLYAETAAPLATPIGALGLHWMLGRLSESEYFDDEASNDHRSISAFVLTFTPSFDPGLTVGITRAVFAPSGRVPLTAALNVLRNVGRPASEPGDTLLAPGPDQLLSVFARWAFPTVGFEVYGEWGRQEQPISLRDFLELPQHSRGYSLGLQYARSAGTDRTLRLQGEVTSLEPSQSFRLRPIGEWYASRRVPQGYTHQGRVIGAAIGPSGSSQWAAVDWVGESWSVGAFLGRIRWENEALSSYPPEFRRADVSLFPGLRGAWALGPVRVDASYAYGLRLNYLFQAWPLTRDTYRGLDIVNHTLRATLSTRGP